MGHKGMFDIQEMNLDIMEFLLCQWINEFSKWKRLQLWLKVGTTLA